MDTARVSSDDDDDVAMHDDTYMHDARRPGGTGHPTATVLARMTDAEYNPPAATQADDVFAPVGTTVPGMPPPTQAPKEFPSIVRTSLRDHPISAGVLTHVPSDWKCLNVPRGCAQPVLNEQGDVLTPAVSDMQSPGGKSDVAGTASPRHQTIVHTQCKTPKDVVALLAEDAYWMFEDTDGKRRLLTDVGVSLVALHHGYWFEPTAWQLEAAPWIKDIRANSTVARNIFENFDKHNPGRLPSCLLTKRRRPSAARRTAADDGMDDDTKQYTAPSDAHKKHGLVALYSPTTFTSALAACTDMVDQLLNGSLARADTKRSAVDAKPPPSAKRTTLRVPTDDDVSPVPLLPPGQPAPAEFANAVPLARPQAAAAAAKKSPAKRAAAPKPVPEPPTAMETDDTPDLLACRWIDIALAVARANIVSRGKMEEASRVLIKPDAEYARGFRTLLEMRSDSHFKEMYTGIAWYIYRNYYLPHKTACPEITFDYQKSHVSAALYNVKQASANPKLADVLDERVANSKHPLMLCPTSSEHVAKRASEFADWKALAMPIALLFYRELFSQMGGAYATGEAFNFPALP